MIRADSIYEDPLRAPRIWAVEIREILRERRPNNELEKAAVGELEKLPGVR